MSKIFISVLFFIAFALIGKNAFAANIAVDFKDNITESEWQSVSDEIGYPIWDNSPTIKNDGQVAKIVVPTNKMEEILSKLKKNKYVEAAEAEVKLHIYSVPNDPMYPKQWGLKRIGSESVWQRSCGSGVTVSVIDTGVTLSDSTEHSPMTDLSKNTVIEGYNFVDDSTDAYDYHGHGSHVAGTIAQNTNNSLGASGLAYCAKILPVKVLSDSGSGTNEDVAEGIRWAADHGADVINLSLGGPEHSDLIDLAIQHAILKNVVVVVAAGNDGEEVYGSPADIKNVVVVSAIDNTDTIADFSNHGPLISIGAPGVNILQETVDRKTHKGTSFQEFSGTSMASPHVAAAAAILKSKGVHSQQMVKNYLFQGADKKNDPEKYGAGILNIHQSLRNFEISQFSWLAGSYLTVFSVFMFLTKRNVKITKGFLLGSFWPSLGLIPLVGMFGLPINVSENVRTLFFLVTSPLGTYDRFLDVSLHEYGLMALPFASLFGLVVLHPFQSLRKFVSGFALGQASYLVYTLLYSEEQFYVGTFLWTVLASFGIVFCYLVFVVSQDENSSSKKS